MLGYELQDLDRMKFALNMAHFYLPPAQEDVKKRLEEVYSFLVAYSKDLCIGHVNDYLESQYQEGDDD